jgi:chemotaxis protein histidine kinase CheA
MTRKQQAQFIPAAAYKPLVPRDRQKAAAALLKNSETLTKAARAIALKTAGLRDAVLALVDEMERVGRARDWPAAFAAAHEIRGLAGTAGLTATGRIANGFCQYLDAVALLHAAPDAAVVNLHIDAITRSARTQDDTIRHGDAVAQQLAALVSRKLTEIKD